MGQISVAEAARRLGVGVARVHQRIADGSLAATRIGSQWVIDEVSLPAVAEASSPGRPLSPRSAWALVAASQGNMQVIEELASAERSRTHQRLQRLLELTSTGRPRSDDQAHAVASVLRNWLRRRAERRCYRASPRDLPDLRNDERLVLSGLSHPASGLASGDVVEGYVHADVLATIVGDYLLTDSSPGTPSNVVFHLVSANMPDPNRGVAPLLLAADLAEHRGPREESRALELLDGIVHEHLRRVDRPRSPAARRDRD